MSAATATTRPAPRPELRRDEARELRIVEGKRPRRSVLMGTIAVVAVAIAAVVVSMILNTRMAQTAFEIREQQLQLNELEAQSWARGAALGGAAAPRPREGAARGHGLVPAGRTGVITLGTGTVEGGKPAQ